MDIKIEIYERNNYTCSGEQDMRSHCYTGKKRPIDRELIYELFDLATMAAMERRGWSGMGAGADVIITLDEDEYAPDSPSEAIEIIESVTGNALPAGSRARAFKFSARQRRALVWDGHNYVSPGSPNIDLYLDR